MSPKPETGIRGHAVLATSVRFAVALLVAAGPVASAAKAQTDTTPPEIQVDAPFEYATSITDPEFDVLYSDPDSGIDLSTLVVEVDGASVLASCKIQETQSACKAPPLADGEHTVFASINNRDGVTGTVTFPFFVDTVAPGIDLGNLGSVIFADGFETGNTDAWGAPASAPTIYSNADDPELVTLLTDVGSGIDPASLVVTVGGVDVTSSCVLNAGGAGCTLVGQAEGEQAVTLSIADQAGNETLAEAVLVVDRTPPIILANADPSPNAEGRHGVPVQLTFVCTDLLSGMAICPGPRRVDTEGADQPIPATAVDRAGNTATPVSTLSIDLTSPTFDPGEFSPDPCPTRTLSLQPEVRACFDDALSGVVEDAVTLSVDDVDRTADAVIDGSCISWTPTTNLLSGEHQAEISAVDLAGNSAAGDWCFDLALPTLDVTIDTPLTETLTADATVDVTGTVEALAETVEVNGVPASLDAGTFSVTGVPLREGRNVITAVARNAEGRVGTASVTVVRDTSPPVVRIEVPGDGAVLTSLQTDVAGLVNDLVTGTTINADDCDVFVNGIQAEVANRSFLVADLLLKRGSNTLVAEARDRLGNSSTHTIEVTVQDRAGQRIVLLAGNNQTADIFEEVPDPLIVALENADGDPLPGETLVFEVSRGDGAVSSFPTEGRRIEVVTDDVGHASVRFRLSGRSGAGNNRVRVTAPGFTDAVEFCAEALPGEASQILVLSGTNQHGAVEKPLPMPLVTLVTDSGGNPVPGIDVTFTVTEGDGSFAGAPSTTLTTDLDGLASAVWTLGTEAGINNHRVEATFPGLDGASPAYFFASGDAPGPAEDTRLVGLVLDNQDEPVPGATVHVVDTALETVTDELGRFEIDGVPVGTILFEVDGTTTPRPGVWPHLEFQLTTVSGQDNAVDRPIYMLPLEEENTVPADAGEDRTLQMRNVPGAELTVFANSVTCPDGGTDCEVTVTQVQNERVPMEPPLGSSFMLAWTIQPAGAQFDPPARLCIPSSGMPVGQQVEMFSFDHDQQAFVATGTATVQDDGEQICSDPGFGVFKAGWHGCVPPPPPPTCGDGCDDGNPCTQDLCFNGTCVHSPQNEGQSCSDGSICGAHQCQGGTCVKLEMEPDGTPCDDSSMCTENDMCMGGFCRGDMIDCDDGNECTADNCYPDRGCVPEDQAGSCDDGDACTEEDQCTEGACMGTPKDCDDENSCTIDSCDAMGMCMNEPDMSMEGMRCDDMTGCSQSFCEMGMCEPATDNSETEGDMCDDMDMCTEMDMCVDGECMGEEIDISRITDSVSFSAEVVAPDELVERINDAVNRIPNVNVMFTELKGGISGTAKDCCSPEGGIEEFGEEENKAMLTLQAGLREIPIWGAFFDLEIDFEVVEIEFEFDAGVIIDTNIAFSGEVGYRSNLCDDVACGFGGISANLQIEPQLTLMGEACLEIEVGPIDEDYCAGFAFTPIKITIPIGGSANWNKMMCGQGLSGHIGIGEVTFAAELCLPLVRECYGFSFPIWEGYAFNF